MIDLVAHDLKQLKTDVCDFIVEIRKKNGEQYPGSSLYDLLSGLRLFLQWEKGFDEKLMSETFKEIHNTLDHVMKERAMAGVGANRPEREFVSHDHEEILWSKNVLGESNPDQLRWTIFFLIGSRFGLGGRKEHHDLRRYPDSQINMVKIKGKDTLIYKKFSSKTCQGGIKDRNMKAPEVRYAFYSGCRDQCFVELYRKYMLLSPPGSRSWPHFYVQTDPKWTPGAFQWYTCRPVGKNTLGDYMQKIMEKGGIQGHFRNHSLHKATATRLFEQGVDPQLIKEATGHKSDAVMLYKKSNLKMKKQVSDMLNVLPAQMQAICEKEGVMMEVEEWSEKRKKTEMAPNSLSASVSKGTNMEKQKEVKIDRIDLTRDGDLDTDKKHIVAQIESKPQINVDPSKGVDLHVPVSDVGNLAKLQGLVNIHFHFYGGSK